jgi:hypothetical protein
MIPPRRLVTMYVMTAHISLALAFALTAANPLAVAGFFYHSRMVALVHLITIGWLAMSILGNVYIVVPMVFGVSFPARRGDYVAFAMVLIGLIGMVAHFWIAEFGGMAWSAATAAAGVTHVTARLAFGVRGAKVPNSVKVHIYFASANVLAAVTMGVLLGFDKVHQFLPGYVLSNVFGHAHLAAVGWVCMMFVGIGYRLLPMPPPTMTPSAPTIYLSAFLLEGGVWGLFVALVRRSDLVIVPAILIVAGLVSFGAHVIWMLERPRHPSHSRRRRDAALIHLLGAAVWLLFACVSGLTLCVLPVSESTLRLAVLYGTAGLVGALAQVVVGIEQRILPVAASCWGIETKAIQVARLLSAGLWLVGVAALATGLFRNTPAVLRVGAWLLFTAALIGGLEAARLLLAPGRSERADRQDGRVTSVKRAGDSQLLETRA